MSVIFSIRIWKRKKNEMPEPIKRQRIEIRVVFTALLYSSNQSKREKSNENCFIKRTDEAKSGEKEFITYRWQHVLFRIWKFHHFQWHEVSLIDCNSIYFCFLLFLLLRIGAKFIHPFNAISISIANDFHSFFFFFNCFSFVGYFFFFFWHPKWRFLKTESMIFGTEALYSMRVRAKKTQTQKHKQIHARDGQIGGSEEEKNKRIDFGFVKIISSSFCDFTTFSSQQFIFAFILSYFSFRQIEKSSSDSV